MSANSYPNLIHSNLNSNTARLMTDLLGSMSTFMNQQDFLRQIAFVDAKISQGLSQAPLNQLVKSYVQQQYSDSHYNSSYSRNIKKDRVIPLGVPSKNSLTDSLLRSSLGCQQKLAKSYLELLDQSVVTQQKQRQKRIQNAKKKFAQNNSYKDFTANSKSHVSSFRTPNLRPVIENQHDSYLKTHLLFIEKPKNGKGTQGNSKNQQKQYYDKHIDTVTRKISELGGMEDTVARMQDSLSRNQIKNFNKRSLIKQIQFRNQAKRNPFSPQPRNMQRSTDSLKNSTEYFTRSKCMRQTIRNKLHIDS